MVGTEQTAMSNEIEARVDVAQVFLVYMALVGDVVRTAAALSLDEADVQAMADRDNWADKVKRISVSSKQGTPGDWERAQNRALNYVQCHQFRRILDRALTEIARKPVQDLIIVHDRNGQPHATGRVFTEMAVAMRNIQEASYAALGDTSRDRTARAQVGAGDPTSQAGIHAALISALNDSNAAERVSATLISEAEAKARELAAAPSDVSPEAQSEVFRRGMDAVNS